jgi:hypothetical protein
VFGILPKGNYPFLALPRPGGRPFVVRRDKFLAVIESIAGREMEWSIVTEPERHAAIENNSRNPKKPFADTEYRWVDVDGHEREKLVIRHTNGHGHGVVKFYNAIDAGSYPLQRQCEDWRTSVMRDHGRCPCYQFERYKSCKHIQTRERAAVMKTLNPRQRKIMKLEAERDAIKLSRPWQMDGPRCADCMEWPAYHEREWNRGKCGGYVAGTYYDPSEREHWLEWTRQKGLRREIMRRARAWQGAKSMNSTGKLYKIVEETGVTVKRWSKMPVGGKRRFDEDFDVYLKRLWEACHGLVSKPKVAYQSDDRWGQERYQCWIGNLHRRKELQSMIDALIAEDAAK